MFQQKIIAGPAGNLEVALEFPKEPARKIVGIVCHPHPLHEGTMNNKVVTTIARVYTRLGAIAIRFNFRGVGQSEGVHGYSVGEQDDLRAVISWSEQVFPDHALLLSGFSFGSFIAAKVATEVVPKALILIAPPVHHNDFKSLPPFTYPTMIVQGEADEIVPPQEVFAWSEGLVSSPDVIRMPGVGHFFHGKLTELRDGLIHFLEPIMAQ